MSQAQTCILKNIKRGEAKDLPDIIIAGSEKKKIIGRNTETQIESSSVSREHRKNFKPQDFLISHRKKFLPAVVIKPKIDEKIILIRFIGKSPAGMLY